MIIENEYDFVGSLTFSWPKRSDQATLNYDDEIYDPLFPVGYGLTYKDDITIDQLDESINLTEESDFNAPILNGWPRNAFQVILGNTDETLEMKSKFVATNDESVSAEMINRFVQEDAYRIMFSGNDDSFWKVSSTKPMNWSEEASQSGVLTMNIRILQADMIDPLIVSTLCGEGCGSSFEIEGSMNKNQWMNIGVDITCMGQNGLQLNNINEPVQIKSNGKWEFEVGEIKLIGGTGGTSIMICLITRIKEKRYEIHNIRYSHSDCILYRHYFYCDMGLKGKKQSKENHRRLFLSKQISSMVGHWSVAYCCKYFS